MAPECEKLSPRQQQLLAQWLPGAIVERDHSWGLVQSTVLEATWGGSRFIVKAGGEQNHHLARELHAHHHWLRPWTSRGRAPVLVHGDLEAKLLVTTYLPGELVRESDHLDDPSVYRQAGALLAELHSQLVVTDDDYEQRENARALAWLNGPHRIEPDIVERLRAEIATWPISPAAVVPTHGDWHPRNWLIHDGVVYAIDFGRAALRAAATDFARLASREFRRNPDLERAFLEGYGTDPRQPEVWRRIRVREAIGTAAWAYQVGDEQFEAHGHRMLAEVLE
ncbi:MAG TPA: aminoglycoside phosphotransferase family protein [Natronosporangium sp.]|nr:aminoglycoside phosphotransferase family protein [Natronosporangium sp.]